MPDVSLLTSDAGMIKIFIGGAAALVFKIVWDWLMGLKKPASAPNKKDANNCHNCSCWVKIEACEQFNIGVKKDMEHVNDEILYTKGTIQKLAESVHNIEVSLASLVGILKGRGEKCLDGEG